MNTIIINGRLGDNPVLRYTQSGKPVVNLSVATNEIWTDANGQKQKRTTWHRVVGWNKTALNAGQYLTKGQQVVIRGRLHKRTYEAQVEVSGQKLSYQNGQPIMETRTIYEIVIDEIDYGAKPLAQNAYAANGNVAAATMGSPFITSGQGFTGGNVQTKPDNVQATFAPTNTPAPGTGTIPGNSFGPGPQGGFVGKQPTEEPVIPF